MAYYQIGSLNHVDTGMNLKSGFLVKSGYYIVPSPSNALKDAIPNSVLHTIYVLEKEILQFLDLKSVAYPWERFQIKNGL